MMRTQLAVSARAPQSSTHENSLCITPPTLKRTISQKRSAKEAEADITRLCGDLAKISIVLDNFLSELSTGDGILTTLSSEDNDGVPVAASESSLRATRLQSFSDSLLSVSTSAAGKVSIAKVVRAIERVRRSCCTLLYRLSNDQPDDVASGMCTTMRQWLIGHIELVEDLQQAGFLVAVSRSYCFTHLIRFVGWI